MNSIVTALRTSVLGSFLPIALTGGMALLAGCDKSQPPAPAPAEPSSATPNSAPVEKKEGPVRASGSSALQPLVNAAKEKYETEHKGASVEVSAGGSKKGLADVNSGAVHIGNSDIFAPDDLKAGLVDHKVAVVGFAAMANKGPYNEKIAAIGVQDLAKIFSGAVKNWKEVGGESQPIVVINRAAGSGTRTVFGNIVLGGDKFVESQTEDNSGALVAKLKQTKGAISYLALSFKDDELKTFSLKGDGGAVEPNAANITSGAYPIWSYEHMYTKGEATGGTKAFLDYIVSPAFQDNVLPNVKGFIAITQMKVTREKD
ncbi:phosphate ABC transporter substrate-binding protein [Pendulispora albinea]|uniref:Phosphate-binding protein n=1 Tax=Pendulispora albinea TaxID=2741071 RepID=A0ABZ2M0P2_9BACT